MSGWTNAVEQGMLNHFMGKATYTSDANHYVALSTTPPTETGTNFTEPVGGAYARKSTVATDWNSATGGSPSQITNLNAVIFATATAAWGTITHWGIFSALSGGTLRSSGPLASAQIVNSGNIATFAAGALRVQLGDSTDAYG